MRKCDQAGMLGINTQHPGFIIPIVTVPLCVFGLILELEFLARQRDHGGDNHLDNGVGTVLTLAIASVAIAAAFGVRRLLWHCLSIKPPPEEDSHRITYPTPPLINEPTAAALAYGLDKEKGDRRLHSPPRPDSTTEQVCKELLRLVDGVKVAKTDDILNPEELENGYARYYPSQ